MAMSRQYRELLPEWGREWASGLIRHAMSTFKTSYVSLSLFDSFHEVFVAENGYNQPQVERNISMSAHVLLSKDVLVVLDATKVCRTRPTNSRANGGRTGDSRGTLWSLGNPI